MALVFPLRGPTGARLADCSSSRISFRCHRRIYQVWLIGSGQQPLSAGLLGAQGAARGMLIAPPPAGLALGAVTVAVTDEPPGGLAAPTGSMSLVGSI
jgi:anti-sigma-K factor RskA